MIAKCAQHMHACLPGCCAVTSYVPHNCVNKFAEPVQGLSTAAASLLGLSHWWIWSGLGMVRLNDSRCSRHLDPWQALPIVTVTEHQHGEACLLRGYEELAKADRCAGVEIHSMSRHVLLLAFRYAVEDVRLHHTQSQLNLARITAQKWCHHVWLCRHFRSFSAVM